jgi:predicted aspartyl protease
MIRGIVTDRRDALIRLTVFGSRGRKRSIEGIIDTGFDGYLTLPSALAAQLGLVWRRLGKAELGDGGETTFSVYGATVLWDDCRRRIEVDEAETKPLVGMKMLSGFELRMKVVTGGRVTITRLRR